MIALLDARRYFHESTAIFIDARKPFEYSQGHIGNALNIPPGDFARHTQELLALQKNTLLVSYCDGEGCNAGIELAAKLASLGFRNVKTYHGGWQEWTSASMPVEKYHDKRKTGHH
jgi:rhodanese-related sulfurtransferase